VDEETRLVLSSLEDFVEQEVRPLENELGEKLTNPRVGRKENGQPVDEVVEAAKEVRRRSADAGFYAMLLPEDRGGGGVSNFTWYAANRYLGTKGRGLVDEVLSGPEGPKTLLLQAEGDQVENYLLPVARAEKSTAFAQTESSVGSDSPNMSTTAKKDGDEWVLNGHKQWISNARFCDFAQVLARTTPTEEAGRYGGITCFIVERDEFEVGSNNNAMGGGGWQAEIILDDVRVPEDRILGEKDDAFYAAMEFLSLGRLELGAEAVGRTYRMLDKSIEYAKQRKAFGKKIGEFQQISSMIARGRANCYGADAIGQRVARKMDEGTEVIEDSSIFNWFATQTFWKVADNAVQVHGANGVSTDNEMAEHLERARLLRIVEGTDEIQLNTIAKQNGLLQ
jgi:acyl-CoA dehydrogenase